MKKLYTTPIINITTYRTIDRTNAGDTGVVLNISEPIAQQYEGSGEIDKDTFTINNLNQ